MKSKIAVFLILFIWLVPVIISLGTMNFWYILLYCVWWIPSTILTAFIIAIEER